MTLVPNAISTKIARQSLLAGKNAPTMLFGAGVLGMVGSTVLACRATLKMDEILSKTRDDLNTAKSLHMADSSISHSFSVKADPETKPLEYNDADYRKDVTVIYTRALVSITKEYGPAILLASASVSCLIKSHDIMTKRNAALTAAYVAVDEAFTRYRSRVVNKYGEEEDREFRYGVADEVKIIDEEGKVHTEKRFGDDAPSMYARFFDEYSTSWSKEPEYNIVFLRCQQKWANDLLKARGHVFLNEVYDSLGIDRTTAGSVVGWIVSRDSDNFIDFGLFADREGRGVRDFINGRNGSILLDFNVDGVIYDKIDSHKERLQWQS
jgi:hypothetical protein